MLKKLLKKSVKLNSLVCLIVCFTLMSNNVFAGSDLDRALSSKVESVNGHKEIGEDLAIALSPEIEPVINGNNCNHITKTIYLEDDIAFLTQLSYKELQPLVELLKNRWANQLPPEVFYSPKNYLSEIIDELEKYAGNTFMNALRGGKGVSYREMLEDVCKKQGIKVNKYISTKALGNLLVEKSLKNAINNMSEQEKNKLNLSIEEISDSMTAKKVTVGAFFNLAYKNSQSFKLLIESLPKVLKNYLVGSLGAVLITAVCVNSDVAGPATRITVPAVTYIEYMRIVKES